MFMVCLPLLPSVTKLYTAVKEQACKKNRERQVRDVRMCNG
jgi:hypothetical protein